ncbi:flagellar protein FlgN [Neobacillus rhizophilus]|uniref:Flagellar protein FlgN n=1 Tax=Neobacillus rhizophilus TaxID=2833579 RepID=A0A942YUK9_9BACI|nr:flagellar protein FlgN [Neobacillus rhizophilus]MBS4213027.1 flagellar protein FlgN [Neobacillus rhizophilus]
MKSVEPLKTVLQEMITVYEKLLEVGNEKQAALIKGDPELLLTIFPKESALIKEISHLEDRRQQEVISLQRETLSELIAEHPFADLSTYQTQLKAKLTDLEKQHELNRQLVESSLDYINSMLSLFTQKQEQPLTYSAKNYMQANTSRSFFDAKV